MPSCCSPCPAVAALARSAGIKSGYQDGKPNDGPQGPTPPCPCQSCCCGKPPVIKACYKQPKVPDSYAPVRVYYRPTAPMESSTTYNLSYLPGRAVKPKAIGSPPPNIVPSVEPMECCTIQKLSYLPNPICRPMPIRPCHHDMWGQGPMQSLTTQRHDYVPKPVTVRESFKPEPKYHAVESPFENRTINRLSYINPGRVQLSESFAPRLVYEKPTAKMDCSTVHKMSFQPVVAQQPQTPPWACKGQYQKPCQRLESTTIYRSSFLPPGEDCSETVPSMGPCNPCPCPATCVPKNPCTCAFPRGEVTG